MAEPIIKSEPIPEQILTAGQPVNLDLGKYFHPPEGQILSYTIDRFPPGLTVNSVTGVVTGTAMNVPFNTPFLVSVTATSQQSSKSVTEYFPITIVVAGQPEEGVVTNILKSKDILATTERWQLQQWIQYLIQEHYACIYIFNGVYPPVHFGGTAKIETAKTGFLTYNYENHLIIAMGDMAFTEGNRGRMLKTIEGVYNTHLPEKNWPLIGLIATDDVTVAKAWVLAKLMHLPVSETAPNDEALFNYRNLAKLRGMPIELEPKPYSR